MYPLGNVTELLHDNVSEICDFIQQLIHEVIGESTKVIKLMTK